MVRQTLLFPSLRAAALFSKQSGCRFLVNTCNFTVTGQLSSDDVNAATTNFGAVLLENTDAGYSYDPALVTPTQGEPLR